jgi:hypothetical protein
VNAYAAVALALACAAIVEIVLPGRVLYHAGWYNVALAALAVLVVAWARGRWRLATNARARAAVVAIAFGASVAALATVASGLLGPDDRTVIGAPGQSVRDDDLGGSLVFPLARGADSNVVLERAGHAPLRFGSRGRDAGSSILRTQPRSVVYVEARDARGGRLTVTQPTGASFLSPVLMMQRRQTIAGLTLPFDSFAVPAAHRTVKAVLFTAQEAATLHGMEGISGPAVLFAVDDANDRPIPHAIVVAPNGTSVRAGGLTLHAAIFDYPAVEIVAAPPLAAVAFGAFFVFAGCIAAVTDRRGGGATARGGLT